MEPAHANLHAALTGAKKNGIGALGTSLEAKGYKNSRTRASKLYNSFCAGPAQNSLTVGHNGQLLDVYLMHRNTPLGLEALPGPRDLALIVGGGAPPVVALGSDILDAATREALASPPRPIPGTRHAALYPYLLLGADTAVQGPLPYAALLPPGTGAPPGPGTAYWAPATGTFAASVDVGLWAEGGHRVPDRTTTSIAAEEFAAQERPDAPVLVPYAGTGEYAHALAHLRCSPRILAFEPHPALAAAAEHSVEALAPTRDPEVRLEVQRRDFMGVIGAAMTRTGPPLPNVVGEIPFVTSTAWNGGVPAFEVPGLPAAPAGPLGAAPPSVKGHGTALLKTESVGPSLLLYTLQAMGPGCVGTFVIAEQFGRSKKPMEESARAQILYWAELLSYVEDGDRAIATFRRREREQSFAELAARSAPRPPALSSPHVRWLGWVPVFVANRELPGMRAGEAEAPTLAKAGVVELVVEPSGSTPLAAALKEQYAQPDRVPVQADGAERHIRPAVQGVNYVEGANFLVHTKHENGAIAFKEAPEGRFATNAMEYAIRVRPGMRGAFIAALTNPETARWVAAVSAGAQLTRHVLDSIPIPTQP